jgi:Cu2+-exporting ATPase
MFFETVVLAGILYAGFKNFKKQPCEVEKKASTETKSVVEEQLTQISRESDNQQGKEGKQKNSALTFKKQNQREIVSALIAMGLSLAGLWLYRPLAFFSIPILVYANKQWNQMTYKLIKQGKTGIETLISVSVVGCIIMGQFFLASLITLIAGLALKLTMLVTQDSRQQLISAFEQHPEFVWLIVKGVEIRIPFNELQRGDIVVICTGEMIPADGTVIEGMASVDQHILTGEARPIEKEASDVVFASTVVLSGKILVNVEKTGQESTVAKITHILNTTVDFKSTTQLRAETISKQLVNPTLIASCVALPILGFNGALAIIVAHPKNKMMGIAPISILNYFKLASNQGILIKDGRSLELLNQVDTIVFDKTGTLTEEQPHIGTIHCYSDYTDNDILFYAAAAEYKQKHPLAKAILQEAKNRQLNIPLLEDSEYKLGYGLIVKIAGQSVHVGSERFMNVEKITIPSTLKKQQKLSQKEGYSLVIVAIDKKIVGAIELLPTVRPEAKAVIRQLKQRPNIKATYIISGDNEIPTQKLAQTLGIDHYFAETLPEDKANIIEQLQQEGHFICYIGDGINDSIAMKKSHVSVSLRGASTIATDTAQIVLMDNGINHLDLLFELAKDFNANMNTMFAIVIVPAIIGVTGAFLLGFGIVQTVILNTISVVLALGNAMTPLLKQPGKQLKSEAPKVRSK